MLILFFSLFLSLAIEPAVNKLARRGWRRGSATAMVLVSLFVAAIAFATAIGALVVDQVANLIDNGPEYVSDVVEWTNSTFNTEIKANELIESLQRPDGPLQQFAESARDSALSISSRVVGIVFQGLTVLLFSFYLVADGPKLRRAICSIFEPTRQLEVIRAWEVAIEKTGGYIYSRALLALFSSIATAITLSILGVPSAIALAIWLGLVSQFIPVIGTYIAGALPVVVALANAPFDGLWVLVFVLVYQQVENYLISPRITARTMELHPAMAFGSALAGGAILGPIGALLALPFAATIQAFSTTYIRRYDVIDNQLVDVSRMRRRNKRRAAVSAKDEDVEPDQAVDAE
jgi:predicted PurR-regulated permease PerM